MKLSGPKLDPTAVRVTRYQATRVQIWTTAQGTASAQLTHSSFVSPIQ